MIPATQMRRAINNGSAAIVTAGRGAVINTTQRATAGRGAVPEDTATRSAETVNTDATEATTATAGRGATLSNYKTPLLIGGAIAGLFFIYQLAKR